MITIDGYTVNPRALMLTATRGIAYAHGARDMHMRTDVSLPALRVYAMLIGERVLDPDLHRNARMIRKPVVRTLQRRARLDLQDLREARE